MNDKSLYIQYAGSILLETPLLNKGSAFSKEERDSFNIAGLLPSTIETIEEQTARSYEQLNSFKTNIDKHTYLRYIQDTNETLYYRLVTENLDEVMPLIYTPTVGEACQQFSRIYRRPRGLFISYQDRNNIDDILQNTAKRKIKVIVVTDGERILGLGDLGIGGMGIPIGKLALYSACGGISPAYTLPITLDVGTNNQGLIDDPMYMGSKHPRIKGQEYDDFVDQFIESVKKRWPKALIQFEDFSGNNANRLLDKYRDKVCSFNDDIQGTAAVTVGVLLAACRAKGEQLKDQIVTFCGAGAAGCGIAEQIVAQMVSEGLSDNAARKRIFMINSRGLVIGSMSGLKDFQLRLCQSDERLNEWNIEGDTATLAETVKYSQSTVIVGVSTVAGLFTQDIIEEMHQHTDKPIVLPLSNPTSRVEAHPADILAWTKGQAIVATGSPFDPVELDGKTYNISQCNNSYIFPGVGLGVISSKATRVTDNMLMASSYALAEYSASNSTENAELLPDLSDIRNVSKYIAKMVYKQAITDGVAAKATDEEIDEAIEHNFWTPAYRPYKRNAF